MPSFIDGGSASVSTTETLVNIPKEVVAIQFTNTGTTSVIVSTGRSGQFSLTIPGNNSTKVIDLTNIIQIRALLGKGFDFGSDGFGGFFTHRTASGTSTITYEYICMQNVTI